MSIESKSKSNSFLIDSSTTVNMESNPNILIHKLFRNCTIYLSSDNMYHIYSYLYMYFA